MTTLFGWITFGRLTPEHVRQEKIRKLLENIMAKLSTLATTLATIETTLTKVKTEIEKLKEQLGDVEIPAEAQATLDRLAALSTALDDLNPDQP
jgi:predicted  nucleic acid-binding Zn-ribbon protein